MPKNLIFAPCERVILGQGDNSASLIVVIQQMQFQVPKDVEIPKEAGAFVRFAIFSQWLRTPEDEGKVYEQRIVLSIGNEKPVLEAVMEFRMTERLHRLVGNIPVLPLMQPGEYSLKLFLREKGTQAWGKVIADYPIDVAHINQLQPQ